MLIAENAKWDLHNRMDDIIDEYLCYNGSIVNMGVKLRRLDLLYHRFKQGYPR
jgi:hypothetical protein